MYTTAPETTSGQIKDILKYLPGNVVDALEDYADSHGMTDLQVIELAISGFLNLESVRFENLGELPSVGALQERVTILETVLQKNGLRGCKKISSCFFKIRIGGTNQVVPLGANLASG
jgi:hypothetical protein